MANTLLTPTVIANSALVILENNLVMGSRVNRRDEAFTGKIGTQFTYRKPNRFEVTDGAGLNVQDVTEPSVIITVDQQKHVAFQFDSTQLTLTIAEFSERYLKSAMAALANKIEADGFAEYINIYNAVGNPGTPGTGFGTTVQLTGRRLDEEGAPRARRCLALDPEAHWGVAGGMQANFVSPVIEDTEIKGYMQIIGGHEMLESQNVVNHVHGTFTAGSTPLTAEVPTEGDTEINTDGWANSTLVLTKGDVFTISAVFAVNPQTRLSTGVLRQFVVTADVTSDGSGLATVNVSPAFNATGADQNIDALPADSVAIVPFGTEIIALAQNLAWAPDAFALAMADLELPQGVDFAARADYKGYSVRIIRDYDINNDNFPCRIDVLYGWKTIYEELAVRLTG